MHAKTKRPLKKTSHNHNIGTIASVPPNKVGTGKNTPTTAHTSCNTNVQVILIALVARNGAEPPHHQEIRTSSSQNNNAKAAFENRDHPPSRTSPTNDCLAHLARIHLSLLSLPQHSSLQQSATATANTPTTVLKKGVCWESMSPSLLQKRQISTFMESILIATDKIF